MRIFKTNVLIPLELIIIDDAFQVILLVLSHLFRFWKKNLLCYFKFRTCVGLCAGAHALVEALAEVEMLGPLGDGVTGGCELHSLGVQN